MKSPKILVGLVLFTGLAVSSYHLVGAQRVSAQTQKTGTSPSGFAAVAPDRSERILKEGQQTFRFDTLETKLGGGRDQASCNRRRRFGKQ